VGRAFFRLACRVRQYPRTGRNDCRVPFNFPRGYGMAAIFIAGKEIPRPGECIVAVDMGYSRRKKSCGFCVTGGEGQNLTFGDMVREVKNILEDGKNPLLVIEAPLSTYHLQKGDSEKGNPERRFKDEKGNHEWYCHAGAGVLLGALRLLEQLSLSLDGKEIRIAEAFLTQKHPVKKHEDVAKLIATRFYDAKSVDPCKEGVQAICNLIKGVPKIGVFDNRITLRE